MSFARFAMRTAALYALRGATLVGNNVKDSDFSAIDIGADGSMRTDADRPFILIYTDDSKVTGPDLRDLHQNGDVDLVCEFGIASAMTEINNDTGESVITGINIPATDAAFEMTLDMIDRQVTHALTGDTAWAEIYRKTHSNVLQIERRRAVSNDEAMRMAARQVRLKLASLPDPIMGQPLAATSVWSQFVAALNDASPELGFIADGFLNGGADLTLEMIRQSHGNTTAEAYHLGYGLKFPGGANLVSAVADE